MLPTTDPMPPRTTMTKALAAGSAPTWGSAW